MKYFYLIMPNLLTFIGNIMKKLLICSLLFAGVGIAYADSYAYIDNHTKQVLYGKITHDNNCHDHLTSDFYKINPGDTLDDNFWANGNDCHFDMYVYASDKTTLLSHEHAVWSPFNILSQTLHIASHDTPPRVCQNEVSCSTNLTDGAEHIHLIIGGDPLIPDPNDTPVDVNITPAFDASLPETYGVYAIQSYGYGSNSTVPYNGFWAKYWTDKAHSSSLQTSILNYKAVCASNSDVVGSLNDSKTQAVLSCGLSFASYKNETSYLPPLANFIKSSKYNWISSCAIQNADIQGSVVNSITATCLDDNQNFVTSTVEFNPTACYTGQIQNSNGILICR
jgi:hypothetical protein